MGISNTDRQLFQYRNALRMNTLIDGYYNIAKACSPDNLERFFNYDLAIGDWLTQLAALFNVKRRYFTFGSAFTLDINQLDDYTIYLDGVNAPVDDVLLRALLKAKILSSTGIIKSVPYIYTVFNLVIDPHDIEITEGVRSLTINVDFNGDTGKLRILNAFIQENKRWFGCPTAIEVTYNITN